KDLLGSWTMYNKQIGTTKELVYPIQLFNMKAFFHENEKGSGINYFDKPFIFQKNESAGDSITVMAYNPQKLKLFVVSDTPDEIVFQQNYYPNWFYEIDGEKKQMEKE